MYEKSKWLYYDRKTDICDSGELKALIDSVNFDAVLDFSSYKLSELKRVLPHLLKRTHLYVFISSDSVYEVCEQSFPVRDSREEDDIRPKDEEQIKLLKRRDSYGHHKLKCEEYLREKCKESGTNFVCLRLADVIGPGDATERWWQLQLWLNACLNLGLSLNLPSSLQGKSLSFVYVKDVAQLVVDLVMIAHSGGSSHILNQSYNLAFREKVTLHQLLLLMNSELSKEEHIDIEYSDDAAIPQYFPSVERGPVDVSKATELLNWRPTSLMRAVHDTVMFYRDDVMCGDVFLDERRSVYESLCDDFKSFKNRSQLRREVRRLLRLQR